jgi:hypothetical protein
LGICLCSTRNHRFQGNPDPLVHPGHYNKNGIIREVEPSVSNFFSLEWMTAIFAFGFFIALWSGKSSPKLYPLHFWHSLFGHPERPLYHYRQ